MNSCFTYLISPPLMCWVFREETMLFVNNNNFNNGSIFHASIGRLVESKSGARPIMDSYYWHVWPTLSPQTDFKDLGIIQEPAFEKTLDWVPRQKVISRLTCFHIIYSTIVIKRSRVAPSTEDCRRKYEVGVLLVNLLEVNSSTSVCFVHLRDSNVKNGHCCFSVCRVQMMGLKWITETRELVLLLVFRMRHFKSLHVILFSLQKW